MKSRRTKHWNTANKFKFFQFNECDSVCVCVRAVVARIWLVRFYFRFICFYFCAVLLFYFAIVSNASCYTSLNYLMPVFFALTAVLVCILKFILHADRMQTNPIPFGWIKIRGISMEISDTKNTIINVADAFFSSFAFDFEPEDR